MATDPIREASEAGSRYACRQIEIMLFFYIEEEAAADEIHGLRRAVELIREYKEGKRTL